MRTFIETHAGLASLANTVIYGTDVSGALVQRPVIAAIPGSPRHPHTTHVEIAA